MKKLLLMIAAAFLFLSPLADRPADAQYYHRRYHRCYNCYHHRYYRHHYYHRHYRRY